MKAKKYTIILSGLIALASILIFAVLQFRLYHLIGISGNGHGILVDIRDFAMVVSSGLFTSACVTLLISIREYIDASWMALRDLKRLVSNLNSMFKDVAWHQPSFPLDLLRDYFFVKYKEIDTRKLIDICKENQLEPDAEILKAYEEDQATLTAYRTYLWDNVPKEVKELCDAGGIMDQYLENLIANTDSIIENQMKLFLDSLQPLRNYDVYQLQAAFDSIEFMFYKKQSDQLREHLLYPLVRYIDFISTELREISLDPDNKIQRVSSYYLLNNVLLEYEEDHSEAYSLAEYHIASGNYIIAKILNKGNVEKVPELKDYNINNYSFQDVTLDILYDTMPKKQQINS